MVYNMLKLILIMVVLSANLYAQNIQGPRLISPSNNAKYIQTNKLHMSWLKIEGEESYRVQHSLDSNFSSSPIEENILRNFTEVTISDLQMSSTYFWRVKADKDNADWSEIWKFTTTGEPIVPSLIAPANFVNNQHQSLSFSWSSNPVNFNYQLHISLSSNFSDTVKLINRTESLVQVSGLRTNTVYYWHVRPLNVDGVKGSWSEKFEFKTVLATPTQIFPQNFTNNIDTTLSLRWNDVATASNFTVLLSTSQSFDNETETISKNILTNKLEIDSLITNKIYYWKVLAINAFNDSSLWTDIYRFKTMLSPPSLVYPSDSAKNINEINTFKWKGNFSFDSYNIQIALDKNFNNILIEEEVSRDSLFVNLENWTNYFWRVSGKNNLGDISGWSKINQFRTKLSKPKLISPKDNSNFITNNYKFNWQTVPGSEEYHFQLSDAADYSTLLFEYNTIDSSIVVDSLSLSSVYYWRVMASNTEADTSNWSNSFRLNTTTIVVESDSINTKLNYSINPTDTIGTVRIFNFGNSEAKFSSINATPKSIYYTNVAEVNIPPNSSKSIVVIGDTTIIDTGFYFGTLEIIPEQVLSTEEKILIPISTYALRAVGKLSLDTLVYDALSVSKKIKKSVIFNNIAGNFPIQINSFMFSGRDTLAFKVIDPPQIIAAGDSSEITIEFSPFVLDSNNAKLIIKTNSYPNKYFEITLTGIGNGGDFAQTSINSLADLSNTKFETLTENDKEIVFKNSGNEPITFSTSFVENYFRNIEKGAAIELNTGDSTKITFQYITPNFDTLNVDTMKIFHNGLGENPLSIPLRGSFDSLSTSKIIIDNLFVNNQPFTNDDILFEENKSISFSLQEPLFSNNENLTFKINYFQGGPGEKQTANKGGEDKYVIPYQNVTNHGLLFKGELFTKKTSTYDIDSVTIFDFISAQIVFDNYATPEIVVPKSTAGHNAEDATSKWVFFGFPFENVIVDSVFSKFGGSENMEDGEWIVYNYQNDLDDFEPFHDYSFNSGIGYFVAQSMQTDFTISYKYDSPLLSRKLNDAQIFLPNSDGWNTVSSPFTFPVEIISPAIVYKYDSNILRYRLTNIMRPGEAYFVEPGVSELNLKTYGEYYPDLFPKLGKEIDWNVTLLFNGKISSDEVVVALLDPEKINLSKSNYLNPPNITSTLDAYITANNDLKKYYADYTTGSEGAVWNIHLVNFQTDDQVTVSTLLSEKFPKHFSTLFLDENNVKVEGLSLTKGDSKICKLIVGTEKYISETTKNININIPSEFKLMQNYPNPFNPSTTIKYSIPSNSNSEMTSTKLIVFDVLGREIKTLVNKVQSAGNYEIHFDAKGLSSGLYYYRLQSGNFNKTMKMLLLK